MNIAVVGPRSAIPRNPTVLVETPSIGLFPVSISSTYTPGYKYSGMVSPFLRAHVKCDGNRGASQHRDVLRFWIGKTWMFGNQGDGLTTSLNVVKKKNECAVVGRGVTTAANVGV